MITCKVSDQFTGQTYENTLGLKMLSCNHFLVFPARYFKSFTFLAYFWNKEASK